MSAKKISVDMFHPGYWLKDAPLRSCSMEARGLWVDLLCFMHSCTPYGFLKVNHKVIPERSIAQMVGLTYPAFKGLLRELIDAGVCQVDRNGCYFSQVMIDNNDTRIKRAQGGRLGGNPVLKKADKSQQPDKKSESTKREKQKMVNLEVNHKVAEKVASEVQNSEVNLMVNLPANELFSNNINITDLVLTEDNTGRNLEENFYSKKDIINNSSNVNNYVEKLSDHENGITGKVNLEVNHPQNVVNKINSRVTTTTTKKISLDNKGLIENIDSNNTNIVVVKKEVNHEVNLNSGGGYSEKIYNISTGNQHLQHPLEVCMWNYFNNRIYDQARGLHCIRLNLDPDPEKCEEKLRGWAAAFNRGQVNDGKLTMAMAGAQESWLSYFPNWSKKVIEKQGYINPEKLFSAGDVVPGQKNSKNGGKKNASADRGPEPDKDASPEEWEKWFYGTE